MREFPTAAPSQFGVFSTRQAADAGWTTAALRHAVRQKNLERLRPGVYAAPLAPEGRLGDAASLARSAAAAAIVNPGVLMSHRCAAALMDLPLIGDSRRVCATTPHERRGQIIDVHLHPGRLLAAERYRANRILVTSPARTVIDIARESGAEAAVVAADAALRRRLVSDDALRLQLHRCQGWPGIRAATRAVGEADALAESALESLSRLRIVSAGISRPRLQRRVFTTAGAFLGRVDFLWTDLGVVGEADGMQK